MKELEEVMTRLDALTLDARDTPIRDAIDAAVNAFDEYRVKGGGAFIKDKHTDKFTVNLEIERVRNWDTHDNRIGRVRVVIYAEMTYRETRASANVNVWQSLPITDNAGGNAYTRAEYFNGSKFVSMPDGR